jgi:hypothetical protein
VLDASRHDDAFARPHVDDTVAEFDSKPAFPDQEELILIIVLVLI